MNTESVESRIMRDEQRRNMKVYMECIKYNPWFAITHPLLTRRHVHRTNARWDPPLNHDQED